MVEFKAANAASHKILVTSTATSLFDLMDTAGSVTTNASLLGAGDAFTITVENTAGIRILMDDNIPTATDGFFLPEGTFKFTGRTLARVLLIRTGGSDIACSVSTGKSTIIETDEYALLSSGVASTTFLGLTDTPSTYVGQAGLFAKVNVGETALEFAIPAGAGDVIKVGTPVNNQMAVWTGDGTLEGTSDLTYDGTSLNLITAKNFQIAGGTVLADAAGTLTLSGIDALDATTETTIEAAIDTLTGMTFNGETVFEGAAGFTAQTATGDGTTTVDWGEGNKFNFTFGAFNETFTFTNANKPGNFLIKLVQDVTGSRTATWPAIVEWPGGTAPTLSTAGGAIDVVSFYFDGTTYYGNFSLNFS